MTRPEFTSRALHWLDIVCPRARRIVARLFRFQSEANALLPLGDPKLAEAIEHHEQLSSHNTGQGRATRTSRSKNETSRPAPI